MIALGIAVGMVVDLEPVVFGHMVNLTRLAAGGNDGTRHHIIVNHILLGALGGYLPVCCITRRGDAGGRKRTEIMEHRLLQAFAAESHAARAAVLVVRNYQARRVRAERCGGIFDLHPHPFRSIDGRGGDLCHLRGEHGRVGAGDC